MNGRVRALRQVEDLLLVHDEGGGAEVWLDEAAGFVQFARHDHGIELRCLGLRRLRHVGLAAHRRGSKPDYEWYE